VDVPRLSQLINKSNQFNLTTRRRSEAEVIAVMNDPEYVGYSMRLKDRFGDHGLISIVIGKKAGETMQIDTWLMSCRVLKAAGGGGSPERTGAAGQSARLPEPAGGRLSADGQERNGA
jgi:FkbH-like protein